MKVVKKDELQKYEKVGSAKVVKPKSETAELVENVQALIKSIESLVAKPAPDVKPEIKFETAELVKHLKDLIVRFDILIRKPVPSPNITVQPAAVSIDMPKPALKWNFTGKRGDDGEWNLTAERMDGTLSSYTGQKRLI